MKLIKYMFKISNQIKKPKSNPKRNRFGKQGDHSSSKNGSDLENESSKKRSKNESEGCRCLLTKGPWLPDYQITPIHVNGITQVDGIFRSIFRIHIIEFLENITFYKNFNKKFDKN